MKTASPSRFLLSVRATRRRGTAAVEFAVIMPFIVMLLLGTWEAGRLIQIQQIMNNAAREGARQAAGGQRNYDTVQQAVANYLTNAGIPNQTNLRVDISDLTTMNNGPHTHGPGSGAPINDFDPSTASQLDELQISVTLPFSNVRWVALDYITNVNTQLTATTTWSSIKDLTYPPVSYPSGD